jgi:predicted DNA-binding transcriptional regulator AlpA
MADAADTIYLSAVQVRRRYGGVSDMTLWRWLRDETLAFPRPRWIQSRRFWDVAELAAWDAGRPVAARAPEREPGRAA